MLKVVFKSLLSQKVLRLEGKIVRSLFDYRAVNEPILEYIVGSKERSELDQKLREYDSKVFDIPIVIGSEEIRTNEVKHQVRPYDHKKKLAKYYYGNKDLLNKAIVASQKAFIEWDSTPLESRAKIFETAANLIGGKYRFDLVATTMLGQGKTIIQAEIDAACELKDFFSFNIEWALAAQKWSPINTTNVENKLLWRGLEGFWAAISPFNFTAIGGHLASAPALMGNVVIWKPSDTAMLSSYIIFKILKEAGLPDGVINFVPCDGSIFGDTITTSPHLAGINFTGSARTFEHIWTEVGKNISNYKSFPRLIGECGGKNFHLIHNSASSPSDLVHIINSTIRSAFEYAGQKCSACSRLYVPKSLWAEVREGLIREMGRIKVGSPLVDDTFFSAVIDDKSFSRIKGHLDRASKSDVLKIHFGGKYNDEKGYYIDPTFIETSDPMDPIMKEEIFGPVLCAYVYPDAEFDKIVRLIDTTTPYALTGAVFASQKSALETTGAGLRHSCGNFYVNDKCTGSVVAQQPFGGARKSGTNDKAGSPFYVLRFANILSIKELLLAARTSTSDWTYPYMAGGGEK